MMMVMVIIIIIIVIIIAIIVSIIIFFFFIWFQIVSLNVDGNNDDGEKDWREELDLFSRVHRRGCHDR